MSPHVTVSVTGVMVITTVPLVSKVNPLTNAVGSVGSSNSKVSIPRIDMLSVGYDYIVYGGPKISGVNIPVGYGDDIFDLFMFDSVTGWYDTGTNIDAGTTHVFNPPTDNMSIRGIETSELLDPTDPTAFVSGLTFETNGTVVMTMTPVTETSLVVQTMN